MSVSEKFKRFISNIQLTATQLEDAKTKHVGVRTTLHKAYYETPYNGSTSFLVGSYGKNTEVRPPSDIDIMCILPLSVFTRINGLQGNKQSQLLQEVKNVLSKTYSTTKMRADGQVVVVPFTSFAVEVVPCFSIPSGRYNICDTNSGGKWKEVDPQAEINKLVDSNKRSGGKTIHLIKMSKVWKTYCNTPIKSFALELLAVEFLSNWQYYDKTEFYYDYMVRDFFKNIINKANGYLFVPGINEFYSLGVDWKSRAESALVRAIKACELEADNKDAEATTEWKKIFGDMFLG